jgi:hypothetical protein
MARTIKLDPILPASDPAMLRMSGKELKVLADGRSAAAKRAQAEIARRKANKAAKKANAAKLAK